MADRGVGVTDTAPGTAIAEVLVQERPSTTITTTTTADPGAGGTTLAVTSAAKFPGTNNYKIRVENEVMLVTAGAGTTSWTVTRGYDNTTAAAHTSGVTVAQVVSVQGVWPMSNRSVSFCGAAASFRTLGNAASPQNLFSIENAAGSNVTVGVSRLLVEVATTAASVALPCEFKSSRPSSLPTGGTTLTKVAINPDLTSSSSVVLRGATASDGGAATAITATAGSTLWHQFANVGWTLVGQYLPDDYNLLPDDIANIDWIILRAGESLLVQTVNATAANNASTLHYVVRAAFWEFSTP